MCGFCIQKDKIVTAEDFKKGIIPDFNGCGTYVCVQKNDNQIKVYQDFNGSYGLCLYKRDHYFALSNSFLRLVEYLKSRQVITMNEDYAKHFVAAEMCSIAYSETMVSEIEMLEKNVIVEIDIDSKKLDLHYIDYKENTVKIDSQEGIRILDSWYDRWTNILRIIKQETNNIQISLSGGFDSRLTFMLALKSGINLDEVKIYSINDNLHTHIEDYEIASQIAEKYHFNLNNDTFEMDSENFTLEDSINISFYTRLGFHKQIHFRNRYYNNRRYVVEGSGGECIRSYWKLNREELKKWYLERTSPYSYQIALDLEKSGKKIIENAFDRIEKNMTLMI